MRSRRQPLRGRIESQTTIEIGGSEMLEQYERFFREATRGGAPTR